MVRNRPSESDAESYTTEYTSQAPSTCVDPYNSGDEGYKSSDPGSVSQQGYTRGDTSDGGYYSEDSDADTSPPASVTSGSLYDSRDLSATSTLPATLQGTFLRRPIRGPYGRSCVSKRTFGRSTGAGTSRRRSVVFRGSNDGLCKYNTIDRLDSTKKANNHRTRKASEARARLEMRQGLD